MFKGKYLNDDVHVQGQGKNALLDEISLTQYSRQS